MQKPREIKQGQLKDFEGEPCPQCQEGEMVQEMDHDAMAGSRSVLHCTRVNPCGFTIDIVLDE